MDELQMMDGFKLLLGLGSFILTLFTVIFGAVRHLSKRISDSDDALHSRVNALKDDMNENFARKKDVRDSFQRVETGITNLGNTMANNHTALTSLIITQKEKS